MTSVKPQNAQNTTTPILPAARIAAAREALAAYDAACRGTTSEGWELTAHVLARAAEKLIEVAEAIPADTAMAVDLVWTDGYEHGVADAAGPGVDVVMRAAFETGRAVEAKAEEHEAGMLDAVARAYPDGIGGGNCGRSATISGGGNPASR